MIYFAFRFPSFWKKLYLCVTTTRTMRPIRITANSGLLLSLLTVACHQSQAFVAVPKVWNKASSSSTAASRRRRPSQPHLRRSNGAVVPVAAVVSGASSEWIAGSLRSVWSRISTLMVSASTAILAELSSMTRVQKICVVGIFLAGFWMGRLRPFWKRFVDVNDIPSSCFGPEAPVLSGRAVQVSDGDTIRFLHRPTIFHSPILRRDEKASTTALPVRVCTIDTPETPKFGKPGQKYGKEAKEKLQDLLSNKPVQIRLLQKDQYSRVVAQVFIRSRLIPWRRRFVDEEMLQAGLAVVYTGSGAVYGPRGKDAYVELENEARKKKVGIWSQKKRESPAHYKKRTK